PSRSSNLAQIHCVIGESGAALAIQRFAWVMSPIWYAAQASRSAPLSCAVFECSIAPSHAFARSLEGSGRNRPPRESRYPVMTGAATGSAASFFRSSLLRRSNSEAQTIAKDSRAVESPLACCCKYKWIAAVSSPRSSSARASHPKLEEDKPNESLAPSAASFLAARKASMALDGSSPKYDLPIMKEAQTARCLL